MKRFFLKPSRAVLFVALVWTASVSSSSGTMSSSSVRSCSALGSLDSSLCHLVDSLSPGARFGLAVRSVHRNTLVHAVNASEWFTPASTLKTLVTAAAIDTLPLDWAPVTTLRLAGYQEGHRFRGRLTIVGGGDPNVSARYYGEAMVIPDAMADSLRAVGIDTLEGEIELDTSWFRGPRRPVGWKPHFFYSWYGAEVGPLSFNDNCVLFRVIPGKKDGDTALVELVPDVGFVRVQGSVLTAVGNRSRVQALQADSNTIQLSGSIGVNASPYSVVLPVRDPARYFAAALRASFQRRGLVFVAHSLEGREPPSYGAFRFPGPPLLSFLDEINQRSQNLHAEMLLRNLAAVVRKEGSAVAGIRYEHTFLSRYGLQDYFHPVDGSGLSPDNRVKPVGVATLLARMARHPRGDSYIRSLGLPGVTGTHAVRLAGTSVSDQIRFKTGFINGVQGLVGYIVTSYGDTLAASIYLNGYTIGDNEARALVDTIWTRIALWHNRESAAVQEAADLWTGKGQSIQGLQERVDYFSGLLLSRPYLLGPTGEGSVEAIDTMPLMDLSRFDCVTYIETSLALALADTPDHVLAVLQDIRYREGRIAYRDRLHYFVADWLAANSALVSIDSMPGDTVIYRTMPKRAFFASKKIAYGEPEVQTAIRYLPYDKALALARNWTAGTQLRGIAFLSNRSDLDVTHTAFLRIVDGKPIMRNASSLQKKTVDQDFAEYLESRRGKTPGVLFFSFHEPSPSGR